MAKNDIYSTRGSAFVDDDEEDAYSRPLPSPAQAASSPSRSRAPRDTASDRLVDKAAESLGKRLEEDEPFLRTRRRTPVKKGILPDRSKTRWGRIALFSAVVLTAAALIALGLTVRNFLENDPRFRVDSSSNIQTVGNSELTRADLLSVFGSDIGRNIFFIPLAARRAELEQIPWVEHATVMRMLPSEIRVAVRERVPIAFVRVGDQVKLADVDGVILDMPPAIIAAKHYSFPVVTGIRSGDPISARKPRMALYQKFVAELDASGEKLSGQMSEIDLSDTEDVRATVPAKTSDLLLHFGDENFLPRYRVYQQHLNEWEQQYPHLAGVDLRYDGQVVLKMADGKAAEAEPTTPGLVSATPAVASEPATAPAPVVKTSPKPAMKAAPKSAAARAAAVRRIRAQMAARHAKKGKQ